ncbi:MAG: 3-keto-5-aminohexanoate cleavage protein [Mycobacterium sp.]
MFLKAAINGGRTRQEAPSVPLTPAEIAIESSRVTALGASVVHAHARTPDGGQSIAPSDVGAMVRAVRSHDPSVIIGTTTGLWTCSGHAERMRHIEGWPENDLPDFASVAFSEDGAAEAGELLLSRGVVLESAVWSIDDVPALLASPTLHDNVRILIEPELDDADESVRLCREIAAIVRKETSCSILYHGFDSTAWPVLLAALEDGAETRIGLEDVLNGAGGAVADNAAMVTEALSIAKART